MKKSSLLSLLFIFLYLNGFSQKQILSFNPPVGFEYSTEFDIQSTLTQTITGIDRTVNVNMIMMMDSHVMESNPDFCRIKMQYKKFSIESSDAFISFTIDSETKEAKPESLIFRSLIDKSFYAKFNRSGEVIEIEGLDRIISDILENFDPEDPIFEAYRKTLEESFGVNNLRQNFQQLSVAFPSYAVGLNDSWDFNLNSKATEFDVQSYSVASIKSISPGNIIIQNNSTIVSSHKDTLDVQGMKGRIEMVGSSIAEIQIDPETGLTKSGIVKQEIEGDLFLIIDESTESEFIIPMKISSRILMENIVH